MLEKLAFWRSKEPEYRGFSDEERQRSAITRKQKAELKKLEFEKEKLEREMELMKVRAELTDLKETLFTTTEAGDEKEDFIESLAKQVILNNPQILSNIAGGGTKTESGYPSMMPTSTTPPVESVPPPQPTADTLEILKVWIQDYPQELKKMDQKALLDLKTRLGI